MKPSESLGHVSAHLPLSSFFAGLLAFALATTGVEAAPTPCPREKIDEVLAPATASSASAQLDCNLELSPQDVVTKRLILSGAAASNTTLDCRGARIRKPAGSEDDLRVMVTSRPLKNDKWEPPENIVIRNCRIEGSVLVKGMAGNGQDRTLTESSRREGHTERVQNNAPRNIVFEKNQFIGNKGVIIYFAPGVHDSAIVQSEIGGTSNSVAIYLDAESARNTIRDNHINTDTRRENKLLAGTLSAIHYLGAKAGLSTEKVPDAYRELIAVDSSAENRIINNRFSNLDHGGIFLYRNCGEGGNIRHQTPHGNEIINNIFYYDEFNGHIPAIWFSSRNGKSSYCDLDKGYPVGSSISNLDYATGNFIAQNQFYKFAPDKMIRDNAGGNHLAENITIKAPVKRKAGCFLKDGKPDKLLKDGEKVQYRTTAKGMPSCETLVFSCDNGTLKSRSKPCVAEP